MKQILFITAFNPSKNDAGSNYTRQLLAELGKFCIVDIIIFKYPEQRLYTPAIKSLNILEYNNISKYTKIRGLLSLPYLFPLFTSRFSHSTAKRIQTYIDNNNYDVVYLDFSQTFVYSLYIQHPNIIFMSHDVIEQRYSRRNKLLSQWAKKSENRLLKRAQKLFTFSEKDSRLIKLLYSIESESTSFFIQKEAVDAVIEYVPDYYVLYGNWKRSDNYDSLNWFLNNVYPELSTSLKFKVIGIGLSEKFQNIIRGYDNIEYLGFVENPYHIIANAKALISPLHTGAGVKVKVVESLACGTPVIGTEIAFEGISEKYSKFMILANSPSEFVQQINQISFSIETRLEFKKKFLELFNDKPVLKYIEGL